MKIYRLDNVNRARIRGIRTKLNQETTTFQSIRNHQRLSAVEVICNRCDMLIADGEKILSKHSGSLQSGHKTKFYHLTCAREVNIV